LVYFETLKACTIKLSQLKRRVEHTFNLSLNNDEHVCHNMLHGHGYNENCDCYRTCVILPASSHHEWKYIIDSKE